MYNHQQITTIMKQYHSMMIEFMHSGRDLIFEDICQNIGFLSYEPEENEPDSWDNVNIGC